MSKLTSNPTRKYDNQMNEKSEEKKFPTKFFSVILNKRRKIKLIF